MGPKIRSPVNPQNFAGWRFILPLFEVLVGQKQVSACFASECFKRVGDGDASNPEAFVNGMYLKGFFGCPDTRERIWAAIYSKMFSTGESECSGPDCCNTGFILDDGNIPKLLLLAGQNGTQRGCTAGELVGLFQFIQHSKVGKGSVSDADADGVASLMLLSKAALLRLLLVALGLWRADYVNYDAWDFWRLGTRYALQLSFTLNNRRIPTFVGAEGKPARFPAFSGPWLKAWYEVSRDAPKEY
mmetsp:Transcript_46088/g.72148  ORF Transcript_46088/g.72148 Transcript_46088/m.72148 type:complete len:244 (-) Transcript_46088:1059-1790(-)